MRSRTTDFENLDPADFIAEWKWDGIRVQAVSGRDERGQLQARLYSRTGEDITKSFPDLLPSLRLPGAIDGELLVLREGRVQTFQRAAAAAEPQSRLAKADQGISRSICAPTICSATTRTICASCRSPSAASGCEAFVKKLDDARIDLSPTGRLRQLGRADRRARRSRKRRRGRGCRGGGRRDAEAARCALSARPAQGTVVEMEARSASDRRGADVCAARPRQALVLLFRLHFRRLDRRR